MRDPAYLIVLAIIIILLLDSLFFNGQFLDTVGKYIANWSGWIAGLMGG